MVSKNTKIFEIDNKKYQFNFSTFKNAFQSYSKYKKLKVGKVEEQLADYLFVSKDAVHNWRQENNGPSDIDAIKQIAKFLNIDYMILLEEGLEITMKEKYSDLQIQSIKRVYDEIIDYLDYFEKTNGFNDLWFKYEKQGVSPNMIESAIYDFANEEVCSLGRRLQKEYFYLHGLKIFDQLYDFVWDDLTEIYDEKCSYGYRFEAPVETVDGKQSGVTTREDYLRALGKIDEIIKEVI